MELPPDAWHQTEEGTYYVDCPECGSPASLMNVVTHGRCNGFLDQTEPDSELDETAMTCTASLWFELGYDSEPEADEGDLEAESGVPGKDSTPGSDGLDEDL